MAELDLEIPKLKLNDGVEIPMLGYGTGTAMYKQIDDYKVDRERVEQIKTAIKVGYHHLDGAQVYNTERELGVAIKESKVPRDQLFVTSKVGPGIQNIQKTVDESLKLMGLDYFDLYLIHEPFWAKDDEDLQAKWAEMEKVKASGKARSIGVSNFRKPELEAILKTAKVIPSINQTEFHAYLQRGDLQQYQESHGIALAAFAPLTPIRPKGRPGPLDDMLAGLSKKYAVNEGEILLRWTMQKNIVAITTSSQEQRLSDMLRSVTFSMTPRELNDFTQTGLEKNVRGFWGSKYAADDFS